MKLFLSALALALAAEGIIYAVFPAYIRKKMLEVCAQPIGAVRNLGILALVCSIIAAWLAYYFA